MRRILSLLLLLPAFSFAQDFKAYNNYDFVPGDTIVFEDHFADDQNGEFPSHWNLGAGQAVMNKVGEQNSLLLTQGNYAHVSPLIKSPIFFSDAFTIEFDRYYNDSYGPRIYFYANGKDAKDASNVLFVVNLENSEVFVKSEEVNLSSPMPDDMLGDEHRNVWHHIAIAFKKNQLKVYIDQIRIMVVPNMPFTPHAFDIEGIGDDKAPIIMSNFRVARGAGMNMLGQKFTGTKIVTHGINFDVDKSSLKPESMGTLNMIVQIMKSNPEVKFEIGGHTDNSGTKEHNLTLSQQRADAVKVQLVKLGVDAARLTTKGFGDSKPLADNKLFEGRANNRRVEFVKK